jgi:hypothetical protein
MPRGRKPRSDAVSQVHIYIPEEVQDYMARMGSMDSASKIRCLLIKAIQDRIPKTEIELKGKLMDLSRAHRGIGETIRACKSKLMDLGLDEDAIDLIIDEINTELKREEQ